MQPEIYTRTLSRKEGLDRAYEYFNNDEVIAAAVMFCTYNNEENELQVTTDNEVKAMAEELHQMMTNYSLVELIKKGLVLPALNENNEVVFSLNR
jgi:phenolic acid decarboxylase